MDTRTPGHTGESARPRRRREEGPPEPDLCQPSITRLSWSYDSPATSSPDSPEGPATSHRARRAPLAARPTGARATGERASPHKAVAGVAIVTPPKSPEKMSKDEPQTPAKFVTLGDVALPLMFDSFAMIRPAKWIC